MGVNEVTRGLERMPPNISPDKQFGMNVDDSEARHGYFQVACYVKLYFVCVFVTYLLFILPLNLCVFFFWFFN